MSVTELQECQAVLGDEDFLISGCHVASVLTYFTHFRVESPTSQSLCLMSPVETVLRILPDIVQFFSFDLRSSNVRRLKFPSPNRKFARTFRLDKVVYAAPRERRERLSYLRIVPILDKDPRLIFLVNSFLLIPV